VISTKTGGPNGIKHNVKSTKLPGLPCRLMCPLKEIMSSDETRAECLEYPAEIRSIWDEYEWIIQ